MDGDPGVERASVTRRGSYAAAARRPAAAETTGAPPPDPSARAAWDQLRKLAVDSQAAYRTALTGLYQAVDGAARPLVDALYWRFWQISDGATLGDPAIVQLATNGGTAPDILRPSQTAEIEDLLAPVVMEA